MATVAEKALTADEFWEWASRPDNQGKRWELDRGEIVEMPPPGLLHGVICGLITHFLWEYALRRKRGYVSSNDAGLLLERNPDTVRGPDVMLFDEASRLEDLSRKHADKLPTILVEVLSPQDRPGKTARRIDQYLERGVPLVWLVYPEERIVTVYRPDKRPVVLDESKEITGQEVLPDLRLQVKDFFTLPTT